MFLFFVACCFFVISINSPLHHIPKQTNKQTKTKTVVVVSNIVCSPLFRDLGKKHILTSILHPGRLTWNLKIHPNWNPENHLNQTIMTSGSIRSSSGVYGTKGLLPPPPPRKYQGGNDKLIGAKAIASFLMFATSSGVLFLAAAKGEVDWKTFW